MKQHVTLKQNSVLLRGELPSLGNCAPNTTLLNNNLEEIELASFKGKRIILSVFPSIDTPVCSKAMKDLAVQAGQMQNVVVLNVSKDLPFALGRFCMVEGEAKDHVKMLSAFRSDFGVLYGLECFDGPLATLLTRCVILIDSQFKISYVQLVPEITQEPDFGAVMQALKNLK
jgi:thiol peroxidase